MAVVGLDTFTDSSVGLATHVPDIGGPWGGNTSLFTTTASTNRMRLVNGGFSTGLATFPSVGTVANYDVTSDIYTTDGNNIITFSLWGRTDGVVDRYGLLISSGVLYLEVCKSTINSGFPSTLASWTISPAISAGSTYTLKLSMNGTSIAGYWNGTSRVSATDSVVTAQGKAGIYMVGGSSSTDSTGIHVDNFQVDGTAPPASMLAVRRRPKGLYIR